MTSKVSNYGKMTVILAVVSIIVIVLIGGCVKESEYKIPEKSIYYYSTPGFEINQTQASTVWEKVNRSDEAGYVTSEISYSAIVFAHPYTVGMFDPSTAEWIVMLSSIPENETEIKIAMFRLDYLTLDMKVSYEFSLPAGEELSLEQSIAIMEEEMKKDNYGNKPVEREKVILQGGNYIYSYPAGDFGGTIIVNKYAGKAVFYATTVWNGKGKIIIPGEESAGIHSRIITPSPPGNTLSQAFNESSGIFIKYWDARNFLGFWGDSETNVSSETLVINQSLLNNSYRVIEKHNLIYTTVPVPVNYQVYRHTGNSPENTAGFYNAIGWLGEKYVLLDGNRIARIILEQNASDAKVMRIGESWGLGEGYRVVAQSIDSMVPEKQGWFVLYKNNNKLEDIIIGPKDVWSYRSKINDSIPTFVTYFQRIYPLPDSDGADLKYIWLMSTQAIEIKEGDIFGIMEVTSAKNGMIELKNKEPIDLAPGKKINLLGNITIEVENSTTDLVFYLNSRRWYQPLRTVMDTIYQDHPVLKDDISMREVGEDYYFRDYILKGLTYTIKANPKRGLNEERIIITLQDGVTERLKSIEIIPEKGEDIYPNIIAIGNFSGYKNQTFVTINDWKEWEVIWQKHTSYPGDKKPIPPKINFSNETIVAIFSGESPYDIGIINMTRQGGNVYVNMNKTYHASPASLTSARSYIIYRLPKIREDVLFRILRWEYREPTEIDKAVEFVSLEQGIAKEDLTVASGQYQDFPRTGRKIWKGIITDRKKGAEFIIYLDEALARANITEVTSKEAERGKFEKLDSRSFELIWNAGPDDEFDVSIVPWNMVENNISAYLASKGHRWNYKNLTARLPKRIIQELGSNDEINSIKVRKLRR